MKQSIMGLLIAIALLGLMACDTSSDGSVGETEVEYENPGEMESSARQLGVSVEILREALGPPPPDTKSAAQKLGVSEAQLNRALGRPPKGYDEERQTQGGPRNKGSNKEMPAPGRQSPKGPGNGGRGEDRYACVIGPSGHCIFTGIPHDTRLKQGTDEVLDRDGNFLFSMNASAAANSSGEILVASGKPASNGDDLIESSQNEMTRDEKAYHRVMAVMFPIRNAIMYDIATVTQPEWDELVKDLSRRSIKDTTYTDGPTPRDNYYGRQGVFDLAKNPDGKDIHHEVMKFLEEAGLYLLCHVTSDEFNRLLKDNHPEGHDPCADAGIITKIPF